MTQDHLAWSTRWSFIQILAQQVHHRQRCDEVVRTWISHRWFSFADTHAIGEPRARIERITDECSSVHSARTDPARSDQHTDYSTFWRDRMEWWMFQRVHKSSEWSFNWDIHISMSTLRWSQKRIHYRTCIRKLLCISKTSLWDLRSIDATGVAYLWFVFDMREIRPHPCHEVMDCQETDASIILCPITGGPRWLRQSVFKKKAGNLIYFEKGIDKMKQKWL